MSRFRYHIPDGDVVLQEHGLFSSTETGSSFNKRAINFQNRFWDDRTVAKFFFSGFYRRKASKDQKSAVGVINRAETVLSPFV